MDSGGVKGQVDSAMGEASGAGEAWWRACSGSAAQGSLRLVLIFMHGRVVPKLLRRRTMGAG